MIEKTERQKCPSFIGCSAPLCPFDLDLKERIWYPDELVCVRAGMLHEHPWIKIQKKIAKKTRNRNKYYTLRMLEQNCVVGKGMVGLDPEREEQPQLKRWLRIHPRKKELTEERKMVLREKMKKIRIPTGTKS